MKIKNILYIILFVFLNQYTYAQRIEIQNNKFVVLDKKILINGANTPWIAWNDFGGNYKSNDWDAAFQDLVDANINCTRVWITCNGEVGININSEGYVSGLTQDFLDDVDSLMQIARSKKIYLMIALTSFDHVHGAKWQEWRSMYKSESNRLSFINNFVIPFVNRYKDNPYFFALEPANEIEWVFENTEVTESQVQDLVALTANAVHENSNILFFQGTGAGPKYLSDKFYATDLFGDNALSSFRAGAYMDFYNLHHYEWMTQYWGTPYDNTPADYYVNSKPAIIGEFPAVGSDGYSPLECYQNIYSNGWQGSMAWTSKGVDSNGDINDIRAATQWLFQYYPQYVYPITDDADFDGIPDDYELLYSGSTTGLVATADNDLDGLNNLQEWIAMTNPNDSNSYFRINTISASNQQATITWNSFSNRTYTIMGKSDLTNDYITIIDNIQYPADQYTIINNNLKFFRIKVSIQQ